MSSPPIWPYERQRELMKTPAFRRQTTGARHVWRNLWLWSDMNGKEVFVSYGELARVSCLSRRYTIECVQQLESAGFIHCQRRRRKGSEKSDTTLISFREPLRIVTEVPTEKPVHAPVAKRSLSTDPDVRTDPDGRQWKVGIDVNGEKYKRWLTWEE